MSILLRGKKSLSQLARAILKSFGSNASSYPFSTRQGAYQTSAGPVAAAVNDPIGLELDALGNIGLELNANPGPFTAATGYELVGVTPSFNSGSLVITNAAAGVGQARYSIALAAGKTYLVSTVFKSGASNAVADSGRMSFQVGADIVQWGYVSANGVEQSMSGYVRSPTDTDLLVSLQIASGGAAGGAGDSASASLISAKEVTGNHATQPTAINRPTLQQDGGGRWYASFNGTNQSMQLASVPFQMADDFCITTCINPGVQAGNGAIFAVVGAGAVARIELYVAVTTGFAAFYLHDDATGISAASGATDIRNSPCVVTLWKVGNAKYLRVNSVQVATDSTVLGTATFTDAAWGCLPVVFADYFNGGNYEGDAIKGTLTLAQVVTLEKAAAQRAGLTI